MSCSNSPAAPCSPPLSSLPRESLAVTEPAWAQAVAGRKKVSKPQDKNIEKSAARARTQLALLEKECEKCKDGLCRACKDLEARNNKDAGPAAVAAADAPEAEE
ncbi:hypothetical protein T484DRAFT_3356681 [Baffinella frigidus]|nr:hypothetical protein T484DRAFT_3356681 [Cryptophyta sp. CCMP2293]